MKINWVKSKAVRVGAKERIGYYFGNQLMPEVSSFKYLGRQRGRGTVPVPSAS
jgi:hypothetical protein